MRHSKFSHFYNEDLAKKITQTGKLNLIKSKLLDSNFVKSINDRKNKPEVLYDLIYKKILYTLTEGYKQALVYNYPPQSRPISIDTAISDLNTLATSLFDSAFAYKLIKVDELDWYVAVIDLELFYVDMLFQEQEGMIVNQPLSNITDIKLLARKISSDIEFKIRTTPWDDYLKSEFVNVRLGLNTGYLNYFFNKTQTEHMFGVINNPVTQITLVGTKNHKDINGVILE